MVTTTIYKNLVVIEDPNNAGQPKPVLSGSGGNLIQNNFIYLVDLIDNVSGYFNTVKPDVGHTHVLSDITDAGSMAYAASGDYYTKSNIDTILLSYASTHHGASHATSGSDPIIFPVTSVNGQTGDINISISGISSTGIETVGVVFDGNGETLTNLTSPPREIYTSGTIVGWDLLSNQSGTITIDVKKTTRDNYPTFASITDSNYPLLNNSQKNNDSILTGWDTTIDENDILQFDIVGDVTNISYISLFLKIEL